MTKPFNLILLPGDGIGPEVMAEVSKLAEWLNGQGLIALTLEQDYVGGAAIMLTACRLPMRLWRNARRRTR